MTEPDTAAVGDVPRPRRRLRRWSLMVAAALVVAFIAASAVLFVWPSYDRVGAAGAVLSLNGQNESTITALAVSMVEKGVAPVLLVSEGTSPPYCPAVPNVTVVCFLPHPNRTVGEIDYAAAYARQHGIHSIVIVAESTQATRARLLGHRCFPGHVSVVGSRTAWHQMPSQVVYEWAALSKALIFDTRC